MGYNIVEATGTFTGSGTLNADIWTFDADFTEPFFTTVTGDFNVATGANTNGEATNGYAFSALSTSQWGSLAFDTVTGVFTFTIDRAAVIDSGSDQQVTFTVTGTSGASSDTDTVIINILICVTRGTQIDTPSGPVLVEDLSIGDRVLTADGRPEPIRWIGARRVAADELARTPSLRPVRIAAGAFGPGRPTRDLRVSPQHRILVTGWRAQLFFGEDAVLAPAKGLVGGQDVQVDNAVREVEYFHLMFDSHEVILTEGLPTESFLPGPYSLDELDIAARQELLTLFPELDPANGHAGVVSPARPGLRPWEARLLALPVPARPC